MKRWLEKFLEENFIKFPETPPREEGFTVRFAIETCNLTKVFKKGRKRIVAVDQVNIKVGKGRIYGLLGTNGAGKSTLIKMLATLVIPTEGTALVNGYDIIKEDAEVRKSIGYIKGGERGFYYRLSGRQNLAFFASLYGIPKSQAKKKIEELIDFVGLTEHAEKKVKEYSTGMKSRLAIARGLLNDPPILLADEPTSGLDPVSARKLRDFMLYGLKEKKRKTILITTHNLIEAEYLCDEIAIMDSGKILKSGTPSELKREISYSRILVLEISEWDPSLYGIFQSYGRVTEVKKDLESGVTRVIVNSNTSETDFGEIIKELSGHTKIRSMQVREPTLEDVFLKITKHEKLGGSKD